MNKKSFQIILLIVVSSCAYTQTSNINGLGDTFLSDILKENHNEDVEVEQVYQNILYEYNANAAVNKYLIISQILWRQYRNAQLEMKYPRTIYNSSYDSVFIQCKTKYLLALNNERIIELKQWYNKNMSVDSCKSTIGKTQKSLPDSTVHRLPMTPVQIY